MTMADDSPGKVQALRAIFSEKNKPLMGILPPGGKISNRPWQTFDSTEDNLRIVSEQRVTSQLITKVLPKKSENLKDINGFGEKSLTKAPPRPTIGPKPPYLSHQLRNSSVQLESNDTDSRTTNDSLSKQKAVAETIASFMFTNGFAHKMGDSSDLNAKTSDSNLNRKTPPPVPVPKNSQTEFDTQKQKSEVLSNIINSDNYICKGSGSFKRKELPSVEKLGRPPLKPSKPSHMVIPAKYCVSPQSVSNISSSTLPPPATSPPTIPLRRAPQRPAYPCPPRPHTPPPLPPLSAPVIKPPLSLREEIEELYEDTLLGEHKRPVSLIPEFTAEEEEAEELYNDADLPPCLPMKPKDPPPPCPSEYLQPNIHHSTEELYQDADDIIDEEFYEEMPCDTIIEETESPLYINNKKEIEKLRREEEKKVRKEQKDKEKREKEMEKLKKKFGLTGEEVPIDHGLVKADSKGGGRSGDLVVRRGETVLILRMGGNPSGRWLVKNEKGKIGYVELTNIEVDPLSVKSVMTIRRLSVISTSEELYCEARSEEEGIYEVTY